MFKLDFSQGIVAKAEIKRSENRRGTIKYLNDVFYVQLHDKSLLPVEEECLFIDKARILYSKPSYTAYCDWTPKKFDKVVSTFDRSNEKYKIIMQYWAKYYEGQLVYGIMVISNYALTARTSALQLCVEYIPMEQ